FNFTPTITGTPRGMAKTALGQFMATVSNNVVRISANGTADTTLGPGGVLAIPAEANSVQFIPHRVLPLSDGSFILGGTYGSVAQGTRRAAFRHYSSIGVLDTTFGTSGTLQINQLSTNTTIDKLVLVNGKAMAIVTDVNAQSSIVRFSTAGVLDSTFDGDGVVTVDPSGSFTEA